MSTVNIHEAKTHLSRFVDAIERGLEAEVIIARNGKPAARLVPIAKRQKIIWGLAKDKYVIPDDIDALNPEIEKLFYGGDD
jgi:prevent-host-death family protein